MTYLARYYTKRRRHDCITAAENLRSSSASPDVTVEEPGNLWRHKVTPPEHHRRRRRRVIIRSAMRGRHQLISIIPAGRTQSQIRRHCRDTPAAAARVYDAVTPPRRHKRCDATSSTRRLRLGAGPRVAAAAWSMAIGGSMFRRTLVWSRRERVQGQRLYVCI